MALVDGMTLAEAARIKTRLEKIIASEMLDFHRATGMTVEGLSFQTMRADQDEQVDFYVTVSVGIPKYRS